MALSVLTLTSPFSRGKDVAQYLTAKHLDKMFIIGDEDFSASTVAGYLNRDIFYLSGNRLGSFIVWDNRRLAPSHETALELARQKASEQQRDVLALLSYRSDSVDPGILKLAPRLMELYSIRRELLSVLGEVRRTCCVRNKCSHRKLRFAWA